MSAEEHRHCDICGTKSNETLHLPLYVMGSEGVEACLPCRMILTELVRGLRRSCAIAFKEGIVHERLKHVG